MIVWFQLYDITEKVSEEGQLLTGAQGGRDEYMEHRGFGGSEANPHGIIMVNTCH